MDSQVSGSSQVVCVQCNAALSQEHQFCDQCGTRVQEPRVCPACQAAIPHESLFCDQCGVALS
jgi:predicted amidophosphoribosyltransferase